VSHLLDTDFCIAFLRENPLALDRMDEAGWQGVAVSVITVAELFVGARKSNRSSANRNKVQGFISNLAVLPLSTAILERFADIKVELMRRGERLEDFDLLIAATALAEGRTLVTGNRRHFGRIPGLRIEDWVHP
jgi:tRNA(fMet)-specific endonuclease VapC